MATLELYLIRHGVAAERSEEYPDDSKRPLTSGGISRLRKEAKALDALGIGFDHIITSPLVRTRQTAEVFAETLKSKPSVSNSDSLAPAGTPAADRARRARAEHRRARRAADWRARPAGIQEGCDLPD
jgi:phosphohistidine phosphatase SixA